MTFKAVQIIEPLVDLNQPLKINHIETPKLNGNQVLVKVKSAGVCHSDLHIWEGGYDIGNGFMKLSERGIKYPTTPGHETAGIVEDIGESVQGVNIGDVVLVYPWIGCENCPTCFKGDTQLCESPKSLGIFQSGGYAENLLVPHYKFLAKIGGLDPDAACLLYTSPSPRDRG